MMAAFDVIGLEPLA